MTALLLDTHALLWWLADDSRLGLAARRMIRVSDAVVSVASFWEIGIKSGMGKLEVDVGDVMRAVDAGGMRRLRIEDAHLVALQALARRPDHSDPFDRLLIAQATVEGLPVLTADAKFSLYPIDLLPAQT